MLALLAARLARGPRAGRARRAAPAGLGRPRPRAARHPRRGARARRRRCRRCSSRAGSATAPTCVSGTLLGQLALLRLLAFAVDALRRRPVRPRARPPARRLLPSPSVWLDGLGAGGALLALRSAPCPLQPGALLDARLRALLTAPLAPLVAGVVRGRARAARRERRAPRDALRHAAAGARDDAIARATTVADRRARCGSSRRCSAPRSRSSSCRLFQLQLDRGRGAARALARRTRCAPCGSRRRAARSSTARAARSRRRARPSGSRWCRATCSAGTSPSRRSASSSSADPAELARARRQPARQRALPAGAPGRRPRPRPARARRDAPLRAPRRRAPTCARCRHYLGGRARRAPARHARRDPRRPARARDVRRLPHRATSSGRPALESSFEDVAARRGRRPQRRRGRGGPRGATCSSEVAARAGLARRARARPRPAARGRGRPSTTCPKASRRRWARSSRSTSRSGDVLAHGLAARPSTRTPSPGGIDADDLEGAHRRRVGAAPEPRDPEPLPARLDVQGDRRGGAARTRGVINDAHAACSARAPSGTAAAPTAAGRRKATARWTCTRAIQQSCDVFFYTVGVQLGIDRLRAHRQALRARVSRRASASPHEATGRRCRARSGSSGASASAGTRARRSRSRSARATTSTRRSSSRSAYAALANGERIRPRLVLRVEDRDGGVREMPSPASGTRVRDRARAPGARAARHDRGGRGAGRYRRPRARARRARRRARRAPRRSCASSTPRA